MFSSLFSVCVLLMLHIWISLPPFISCSITPITHDVKSRKKSISIVEFPHIPVLNTLIVYINILFLPLSGIFIGLRATDADFFYRPLMIMEKLVKLP